MWPEAAYWMGWWGRRRWFMCYFIIIKICKKPTRTSRTTENNWPSSWGRPEDILSIAALAETLLSRDQGRGLCSWFKYCVWLCTLESFLDASPHAHKQSCACQESVLVCARSAGTGPREKRTKGGNRTWKLEHRKQGPISWKGNKLFNSCDGFLGIRKLVFSTYWLWFYRNGWNNKIPHFLTQQPASNSLEASQLSATVVQTCAKPGQRSGAGVLQRFPSLLCLQIRSPSLVKRGFHHQIISQVRKKSHYRLPHLWFPQSEFLVMKHRKYFIKDPEIKAALDWKPQLHSHSLANTSSKFNPQYRVVWGARREVERKEKKEDERKRKISWRNGSVECLPYKHGDLSSIPQHLHTNARAGGTCSQSPCWGGCTGALLSASPPFHLFVLG